MSALFLALAALAYLVPEYMPKLFGGTHAAWEYVTYGAEASLLWLFVGATVDSLATRIVALWGFFEAAQRPVCRLAFPMDRAPQLNGQNLCDVATGLPMSLFAIPAALFAACVIQEVMREGR